MNKCSRFIGSALLMWGLYGCSTLDGPPLNAKETATSPHTVTGATFAQDQAARLTLVKTQLEAILKVKDPRTVDNTLLPYREMIKTLSNGFQDAGLFSRVHPDKSIRDEALKSEQELAKFATEQIDLNRELYDALKSVKVDEKNGELAYFHKTLIRDYQRSGVDKDEATRKKIADLNDKIVKSSQEFSINLQEDVREMTVKPEELKGLPDDYLKPRLRKDGTLVITTDYPDMIPVMSYADNAEVRRKLWILSRQRGYPKNETPLQQTLAYRHELAAILGYANWADYNAANKMVGSGKNIDQFLTKVHELVKPRARKDYEQLLREKKRDDKKATKIYSWDISYYNKKAMKRLIDFNPKELRDYFPYAQVKQGAFAITEKLYGVTIKKLDGAQRWHDRVESYVIEENGKTLGYFDLDMFPRKDKYKHAAQFTYRQGIKDVQLPHAVLVCNFPEPTKEDPGLLEHSDVETFLHEFGHLLHKIFAGHNSWDGGLEWDFVETPSQLFEEWTYDKVALDLFARHYRTGKPMPQQLVHKLNQTRYFGLGYQTLTQVYYANLSLSFHNRDPKGINADNHTRELWLKYLPTPFVEGTHFAHSFDHLMGYSSGYYTYMWSLVIAKDFTDEFKKKGIFSRDVAARYRKFILEDSGTRDANAMINGFLGRPYAFDAFARYLKEGAPK
jgi:thimet oligopeptidase